MRAKPTGIAIPPAESAIEAFALVKQHDFPQHSSARCPSPCA